jgi:hypothetical protein
MAAHRHLLRVVWLVPLLFAQRDIRELARHAAPRPAGPIAVDPVAKAPDHEETR